MNIPALNRRRPEYALIAGSLLAVLVLRLPAATYPVALTAGDNLIANHAGATTLNILLPVSASWPASATAYRWDVATQAWQAIANGLTTATTPQWSPNAALGGAEGFLCRVAGPVAQTISVPGTAAAPPASLPANQFLLLANNPDVPAVFADLLHDPLAVPLGSPGVRHTYVGRWIPALNHYDWSVFDGSWRNAAGPMAAGGPVIPTGESVFVGEFTAQPAPRLVAVRLECDPTGPWLDLEFDHDVDPVSAAQIAHYTVAGATKGSTARVLPRRLGTLALPAGNHVQLALATVAAAPATIAVSISGVASPSGATIPSSGTTYSGAVVTSHYFDCASLNPNDRVDSLLFSDWLTHATVMNPANWSFTWTGPGGTSGSLAINTIFHNPRPGPGVTPYPIGFDLSPLPAAGGSYTITVSYSGLVTECGVAVNGSYTFVTSCGAGVTGRVFNDLPGAGACVQSAATDCTGLPAEFGLPRVLVRLTTPAGLLVDQDFTGPTGDYQLRAAPGAYVLQAFPGALWAPAACNPWSRPIVIPPTGAPPENVAATAAGGTDLGIWTWIAGTAGKAPCCGEEATIYVIYGNYGTTATAPAPVSLNLPGVAWATYVPGSPSSSPVLPAPAGPTAGVLTWTVPALAPGTHGWVSARVKLTCPLGSLNTLSASASITPGACPAPDANAANNTSTTSRPTTCAYDPNGKAVDPEGCGPGGRVLRGTEFTYRIDFQNTGSGTANQVVIEDDLDPGLDPATFTYLGASHAGGVTIDPVTRRVTFTFRNIGLPAAMFDEPGSHGFVVFKVRHLPGIADGTAIRNGAAIFFDRNPAILTGITRNTIVDSLVPPTGHTVVPATGTAGQPVQFHYTGPADAAVSWTFPGGSPATSTSRDPVVTFPTAGAKQVNLVAAFGDCPPAESGFAYTVNSKGGEGCCDDCPLPHPVTLVVPVAVGYNFLVNPLCHGNHNTVADLLPDMPADATLTRWDKATQTYGPPVSFIAGVGWDDPSVVLPPGEGFVLESPIAFSITFTGCRPACLPTPPRSGCCLIGPMGNTDASWEEMFGGAPRCEVTVQLWNGVGFERYDYLDGEWLPMAPHFPAGRSAIICVSGADCPPACEPPVFACVVTETITLTAGNTSDNFTGPEMAAPSSGLASRFGTLIGFDQCPGSAIFAHTFTNLPACIQSAQLCFRAKSCGDGCGDDAMNLALAGTTGQLLGPGYWLHYLGAGNPAPGLVNFNWCNAQEGVRQCLDLAHLPPGANGGTTDWLQAINDFGFLDVTFGEETAVDFLILQLQVCRCRADLVVSPAAGQCGANVSFTPPAVSGGCAPVNVTCDPPSGSYFPVGTNEVICTAVDATGQRTRGCFRVIVRSLQPPVIVSQPADLNLGAAQGIVNLAFNVAVTSPITPVSYQWYRNGQALVDGNGITGAQGASLTYPRSAGTFPRVLIIEDQVWCVITTPCGTVTSRAARASNMIIEPCCGGALGGHIQLRFSTRTNATYVIEAATPGNLGNPQAWSPQLSIPGTGQSMAVDVPATGPAGFYRIREDAR